MAELGKKSRWVNEAIGPANDILRRAGRGLVDLPIDVTPGARQIAQLTAWRAVQSYAIDPVRAALEELGKLPDWSGGFLVVDTVNFDWRTAPFRHYESFEDFYRRELEPTWEAWDQLQKTSRRLIQREFPRLCRGGSQSLTDPGVYAVGTRTRNGRMSDLTLPLCAWFASPASLNFGVAFKRLRKGPFEGPATVKPPALPEDIYSPGKTDD